MQLRLFRFQHGLCQFFGALVVFHDWLQLANLEYVSSITLEYTVQNLLCQVYTCNLCSEYNVFWHFHTDKSSSGDAAIFCFNGCFSVIILVIFSANAITKIHRKERRVLGHYLPVFSTIYKGSAVAWGRRALAVNPSWLLCKLSLSWTCNTSWVTQQLTAKESKRDRKIWQGPAPTNLQVQGIEVESMNLIPGGGALLLAAAPWHPFGLPLPQVPLL